MDDFDSLIAEAHARGLKLILDLVPNHTSDQHPWFVESRSSRDNPRRDWYLWRDPAPGGGPPNNWQSVFGGPGWEMDAATGQYYFHMFCKEQPDVNWRNPQVRQAMLDVFRFWLERGVDGFRLDVFNVYFKSATFADNPAGLPLPGLAFFTQKHRYDVDQPEMMPLLKEIRDLLDAYSTPGRERYAVGETFGYGACSAADYMGPDKLHAAFNFAFLGLPWNADAYLRAMVDWEHALGHDNWPDYVFNNHDAIRSATRLHALVGNS
jgi:alpha-glucosidase